VFRCPDGFYRSEIFTEGEHFYQHNHRVLIFGGSEGYECSPYTNLGSNCLSGNHFGCTQCQSGSFRNMFQRDQPFYCNNFCDDGYN
jgi:hypothetical protein